MSRGVRALTGVALMVVGTVTGQPWLISTGATLVLGAVTEPDVKGVKRQRGKRAMVRSAVEPQEICYGRVPRKSGVVTWFASYGPDNKYLVYVITVCEHEIDGYEKLWIDETAIDVATEIDVDGFVTHADFVDSDGNKLVKTGFYLGTDSQVVDPDLDAAFSEFTTDHKGQGVAYFWVRMELDNSTGGTDPENPSANVWNAGVPRELSVTLRGKKVYDPRLDSTNGGTGAHRLADSSTWEWSENPILQRVDYLRETRLGPPIPLADTDFDWSEVAAEADICDELVTITGSDTQKRYTSHGVAVVTDNPADIVRNMQSADVGKTLILPDRVQLKAGAWESPTHSIDDSWLSGGVQVHSALQKDGFYNAVRGKHINADGQQVEFPSKTSSAYETEDGGNREWRDIDLPWTTDTHAAQRLAIIELKKSRQQTTVTLECNYRADVVEVWDTAALNLSEITSDGGEPRRNLIEYSEQLDNSVWGKEATVVVADTTTAPDGSSTAELVYPSGSTSAVDVHTWDGLHTFSFYAKAAGFRYIGVAEPDGVGTKVSFDLTGGTVSTDGTAYSDASIEARADGWYRCSVTGTSGHALVYFEDTPFTGTATPSGTNGAYLWGAQLEEGNTATTYQHIENGVYLGLFDSPFQTYRVVGKNTSQDGTVTLSLREEVETDWTFDIPDLADPPVIPDVIRNPAGIPAPSSLAAESAPEGIRWTWTLPNMSAVSHIELYTSADNNFANATLVTRTASESFTQSLAATTVRYGWILARGYNGLTSPKVPSGSTDGVMGTAGAAGQGPQGDPGEDAIEGFAAVDGPAQWVRDQDGSTWEPVATTTDIDWTFQISGTAVGRVSRRITRDSAGLLTVSTTTHPAGDLNGSRITLVVTGGGTRAVSIQATYDFDGHTKSITQGISSTLSGADGDPGLSVAEVYAYQRAAAAPATPTGGSYSFTTQTLTPPSGWSASIPAGTDPVYITVTSASVTGTTGDDNSLTWSTPVKAFSDGAKGDTGDTGSDGSSVDIIFQRAATQPAAPDPSSGTPAGWYSDVNSVPVSSDLLWSSVGTRADLSSNFVWQTPVQVEGEDGGDGLSVAEVYAYRRASSTPATPTGGSYDFDTKTLTPPTGWTAAIPTGTDPVYITITSASVVGTGGVDSTLTWSAPVKGFADGGSGVDGQGVDMVFKRAASQPSTPAASSGVPATWYTDVDSVPAGSDPLWSSIGTRPDSTSDWTWQTPVKIEGQDGGDGRAVAEILVFRRAASTPATPSGGTYNFGTQTLTTPPTGWTSDIPAGTDPVYSARGVASIIGTTGTDTPSWGTPAKAFQDGTDGTNGTNGDDGLSVVDLTVYRRAASAPAAPSGGSYNFGTQTLTPPTDWSADIPSGTDPVYASLGSAAIIGQTGTDTPAWGTPARVFQDGEDGSAGLSVAELIIYRRASSAPSTPTGGSYSFTTQTLTPPTNWSSAIPAGTDPVYTSRSVASISGVSGVDSTLTWSSAVKSFEDGAAGADGQAVDMVFRRSATQPSTPASSSGVPAGWYTDVNSVPASSDPLWSSVGTRPDPSTNWTWQTPIKVEGQDGAAGEDAIVDFPHDAVSYHPLDEGEGTSAKDVRGGYTGTLVGSPVWTDGVAGGALYFPNTSGTAAPSHYMTAGVPMMPAWSDSFTLSIWVNLHADNAPDQNTSILFGKGNFAGSFGIIARAAEVQATVRHSGATVNTATVSTPKSAWHHVAVSYDGSTGALTLYVDGASGASATVSSPTGTPSQSNLFICNGVSGGTTSQSIKATTAEPRAYDRALTADEVKALYLLKRVGGRQVVIGDDIVDGAVSEKTAASKSTSGALTATGHISEGNSIFLNVTMLHTTQSSSNTAYQARLRRRKDAGAWGTIATWTESDAELFGSHELLFGSTYLNTGDLAANLVDLPGSGTIDYELTWTAKPTDGTSTTYSYTIQTQEVVK